MNDHHKNSLNIINSIPKEELKKIVEDFEKEFPLPPKGWLDINDHLPMMLCKDLLQGYSTFKVKDKTGKEFYSNVGDGMIWLYEVAKPLEITHWLNK